MPGALPPQVTATLVLLERYRRAYPAHPSTAHDCIPGTRGWGGPVLLLCALCGGHHAEVSALVPSADGTALFPIFGSSCLPPLPGPRWRPARRWRRSTIAGSAYFLGACRGTPGVFSDLLRDALGSPLPLAQSKQSRPKVSFKVLPFPRVVLGLGLGPEPPVRRGSRSPRGKRVLSTHGGLCPAGLRRT